MSETENKMNEAKEAIKKVSVSAPRPRPAIGNVAANISTDAVKQAALQVKPVEDAIDAAVAFKFAFIGSGQGGSRIANSFWQLGYRRVAAFNTTEADFDGLAQAMQKLSLEVGGASKDTELARQALRGREEDVRDLLSRAWSNQFNYGMVCASLGGGTGSGTAPELVTIIRKYMTDHGIAPKVGAIVSLPPVSEGYQICRNAVNGFRNLIDMKVSPLIIIDNARIHTLYRPPMAQLHQTANSTVAQLLHLFNQLAAVHSPYITFDKSELGQILDSGLITMGASDIVKVDSPADISGSIRENLGNTVLAQVDLATGKKAACLFVAGEDILNRFDMDYFDAGYTAVDRLLSGGKDDAAIVLHRGLYPGAEKGIQAYTAIGGLEVPHERMQALARKGGLLAGQVDQGIAEFLRI